MTAEIVIMNLESVALAADSAVTAASGQHQKIFASQNKLFALSSVAPVGVLVFGNASFMDIPWETLVKDYRRQLGDRRFDHLTEYAADFGDYLTSEGKVQVSRERQSALNLSLANRAFALIAQEIRTRLLRSIMGNTTGGVVPSSDDIREQVRASASAVIDEWHSKAAAAAYADGMSRDFVSRVRNRYRSEIADLRRTVFADMPLGRGAPQKLNQIALKAMCSFLDEMGSGGSPMSAGLAIAGFGEAEVFPSARALHTEGLLLDTLKVRWDAPLKVGPGNEAVIAPFAQIEMVYLFMEGIDPDYLEFLEASFGSYLREYTHAILEGLSGYVGEDRERISERLHGYHGDITSRFLQDIRDFGTAEFSQPVVNVVAMLPTEQLAEMAETLVSLTSFKRHVSLQEETVAGPIDVAVITKGDGLIWVKRKHYFPAPLNPAYFARTYGRGFGYGTAASEE